MTVRLNVGRYIKYAEGFGNPLNSLVTDKLYAPAFRTITLSPTSISAGNNASRVITSGESPVGPARANKASPEMFEGRSAATTYRVEP